MLRIKCCYKCENRAINCHSTCKTYIDEKERYAKDIQKAKQLQQSCIINRSSFNGNGLTKAERKVIKENKYRR